MEFPKFYFLHNDSVRNKMNLRQFQFKIFRALCGNKFTRDILSTTMIVGIQMLSEEEASFINSLKNIREIAAAFIFVSIKYGGKIKTLRKRNKGSDKYECFDKSLELFLRYVDTGFKPMTERIYVDTPLITRKILSDMRGGCQIFNNEELKQWSNYMSIEKAILTARKIWQIYNVKKTWINKKFEKSRRRPRTINI